MKLRKSGITFLLGTAIASATPAPVLAQTCAEVVGSLQARTAALNNEARVNSANFLLDELVGPALERAKRTLAGSGDPTVAAYNQVQDAREKVQAWIDRLNSFDAFMTRLKECHATGCNMFKFLEDDKARSRLAEAAQEKLDQWVQSLGDSGITAAAERVNKVSSIVKNTLSGAQGIAQDGITDAVSCMDRYVQTAQAAQADPIDPGVTAPGVSAPPPAGGSSVGKIVGWTALTGGAILAGAYAASQVEPIDLGTTTGSSNTTTTRNNNPAPVGNTAATIGLGTFNCGSANATSNFRSCVGSINVRAGTLIGARQGTTISAVTQPSVFVGRFTAPASGGTTGTVELRATVASCPVQTAILFSVDGTVFFESIAVSIPVSCP